MASRRYLRPASDDTGGTPQLDDSALRSRASRAGLPAALARRVPRHLSWAAGVFAGVYGVNLLQHVVGTLLSDNGQLGHNLRLEVGGTAFVLAAIGIIVAIRSGKLTIRQLVFLGLAFEVVGTIGIAIGSIVPRFPATPITTFVGLPWTAVWIMAYPLMVPSRPRDAAIAGVLSVAAVVAGLQINVVAEGEAPIEGLIWYMLVFVNLVCAAWGVIASIGIYNLGREVSAARRLGSYELEERLGKGGMGEVWRARHRLLARPAAVKLILPEALGNQVDSEVIHARFEREAQATASLDSPHTVGLYDYGSADDGTLYYVMELLVGVDLETLVKRHGPVQPARAIHWLRQACHSLAEAHHNGYTHRDIKPANLFTTRFGLEYDFLKVLDFGLVKLMENRDSGLTALTGAHTPPGTPAYMPPEVAMGDLQVDGRADIYALGCVGYWLLTGDLVFPAETPMKMVLAHLNSEVEPPSLRTEMPVPDDLEAVLLACLAKSRDDRPATALDLSEQLARCRDAGGWDQASASKWWELHGPGLASR